MRVELTLIQKMSNKGGRKMTLEEKAKENEQPKKNDIEKALEVLIDNGNLFFKDYEGKVSPISYCDVDDGKIFFME